MGISQSPPKTTQVPCKWWKWWFKTLPPEGMKMKKTHQRSRKEQEKHKLIFTSQQTSSLCLLTSALFIVDWRTNNSTNKNNSRSGCSMYWTLPPEDSTQQQHIDDDLQRCPRCWVSINYLSFIFCLFNEYPSLCLLIVSFPLCLSSSIVPLVSSLFSVVVSSCCILGIDLPCTSLVVLLPIFVFLPFECPHCYPCHYQLVLSVYIVFLWFDRLFICCFLSVSLFAPYPLFLAPAFLFRIPY